MAKARRWEIAPQINGTFAIDEEDAPSGGRARLGYFLARGPAKLAVLAPEMAEALREAEVAMAYWVPDPPPPGESEAVYLTNGVIQGREALAKTRAILARLPKPVEVTAEEPA